MPERSRDWLDQAHRDLASARWSLEGGFFEWTCFSCQQAAEKAIKAVFHRLGGEAWGHSVLGLLRGLSERVDVPAELRDCARLLDRFYIPARYPNGWETGSPKDYYTREDAESAVRCGEAIIRFCDGLLAQPPGGGAPPQGGGR